MMRLASRIALGAVLAAMPVAASAAETLPQISCNFALSDGEATVLQFDSGSSARVMRFDSARGRMDVSSLRLSIRDTLPSDALAYGISDGSDDLVLVLEPLPKFEKTWRALLWGDITGDGANLPVGAGMCKVVNADSELAPLAGPEETPLELIDLLARRPAESGRCHAVNGKGERFTFLARPNGNFVDLELDGAGPLSGTIQMARVQNSPAQGPALEFTRRNMPPQLVENWISSKDGNTRGEFEIFGRDISSEWIAVVALWAIDGKEEADMVYAAHCGGVVE